MKAILKLTVMMLVLAGSLGSCDKENGSINGVWESYSYPDDAMVTLTIHSNRVAVTTSPNDVDGLVFHHGDRFMVLRDTLFLVDSNGSHNELPGFAITKLSPNSMELEYLGILPAIYLRTFLFTRKSN